MKKSFLFLFLVIVLIIASGCTLRLGGGGSSKESNNGSAGVWKSADGGQNWQRRVAVPTTSGTPGSIENVSVRRMVFDPQDRNAIYLATEAHGILYTYNGGNSWNHFPQLDTGLIRSVVVDPLDKCNLYAVAENKLYKSIDCGRSWENTYYHQTSSVILTDVEVDYYNNSIVFISNNTGEILRSLDGGHSWQTVFRVTKGDFVDLVLNPNDNRMIYAATSKYGLYKSSDGGTTWNPLGEGLKAYAGSSTYKELIIDPATFDGLILVSRFGLLRSYDGGDSWEIITLLPVSKATTIYGAAVDPKNSDVLYYTTADTIVKSLNGGETWTSHQLPFTSLVNKILVNPEDTDVLYMGMKPSNIKK